MSEDMKRHLSTIKKGKPSPNKGRKFSREWRSNLSLSKKGKPSPFKGKKLSIESREKMRQARIKFLTLQSPDYKYEPNPKDDRKWVRRERHKKYGGCHSVGEWDNLKAQYNWTCPRCKKKEPDIILTRDHIIPVSRGGSDNIENIQPLCKRCNSLKATVSIKY